MTATIDACRGPEVSRRLTAAQTTNARLRPGKVYTKNIIPCNPVIIDSWVKNDVTVSASIMRTKAPQRSKRGARLKNTHHKTSAKPLTSTPSTPISVTVSPGATRGTPNLNSHCSMTMTTPGHNLSGNCRNDSPDRCASLLKNIYSPYSELFVLMVHVNYDR
ncbi:hypothetical protein ACFL6H_07110 [Candidatus Latescibacterota bacterium]